jgi:hypothetical protein
LGEGGDRSLDRSRRHLMRETVSSGLSDWQVLG